MVFIISGAAYDVDALPLRLLVPVAKPVTAPAPANEVVFHVAAFAFSQAVG